MFTIQITDTAAVLLKGIADLRVRALITERINQLTEEPDKQGKPLTSDLLGYRSVRAVGQRYRIIYRIEQEAVIVVIVALGLRKEGSREDIYALAQKLLRQGLLDPPQEETEEAP